MNEQNRSQIITGSILIGIGLLFLLQTLGLIHYLNWRMVLRFWPVFLILIGLNILFKGTRFWWIVPIMVVLTFLGLVIIFQPFFPYHPYHYQHDYKYEYDYNYGAEDRSGIFRSSMELNDKVQKLNVDLNFGGGDLEIGKIIDEKELYSAYLKYEHYKPEIEYDFNENNGVGTLKISQSRNRERFNFTRSPNDWSISFSDNIPLAMEINAGAGDFDFNFRELQVQELIINVGAGALEIDLGRHTDILTLNSGAASVDINVPEGTGVEIENTGVISANNFVKEGLIRTGNTYRTENFDNADEKITIKINASASKIDVNFYRVNVN